MANDKVANQPDPEKVRALKDAAQKERAVLNRTDKIEGRNDRRKYGSPLIRASINAPHSVQCRGASLVIKIKNADAPAGADSSLLVNKEVIIVDNGTANNYLIIANFTGPA